MKSPFERAMLLIDGANAADPNTVVGPDGPVPKELLYSTRMTAALARLYPAASETLQLAVRAQHLERWRIARDTYPDGRAGYNRWRADLAALHATRAGELLMEAGYGEAAVEHIQGMIRKQSLRSDAQAQALEDTACLVFLEHYLPEFSLIHDADRVVSILRKTWAKMSEHARAAALALPLGDREAALVGRATRAQ